MPECLTTSVAWPLWVLKYVHLICATQMFWSGVPPEFPTPEVLANAAGAAARATEAVAARAARVRR